jgi:hypothetical protein
MHSKKLQIGPISSGKQIGQSVAVESIEAWGPGARGRQPDLRLLSPEAVFS